MAAFSLDLRQRALADCPAGFTYAAIARRYTVSAEWVRTFYKRFREAGEVAARSHAIKRQPYHVRREGEPRAAVAAKPDRTLEHLRRHPGGAVSIGTLGEALRASKIASKGSRSGRPNRTAPTPRPGGPRGGRGNSASTRAGSCSWTRRG